MQEILLGQTTEQAQNQLQNLAAITDRILTSAKLYVIEDTMTEKHFVDLSERISLLSSVASTHAEKHGDLTRFRIPIGQKPADVVHPSIDPIINGLLDHERHRKGMTIQGLYKSLVEGLYVEKTFGLGPNSSRVENFYLSGPAHLPGNRT